MQDKLPFHLGGHFARATKRLQRLLPELRVQYDQGGIVRQEQPRLEVRRSGRFEQCVYGRLLGLSA